MTLQEGEVLGGRYRIVRLMGQGGMGAVWEARHEKLGARVCLKTIAQDLSQEPEFRQRFELEAQAAARLTGPHVVKVFDVDSTPEGLLYMAMEFLEGTTLGEAAAEGAANPAMLVDWLVQSCAGLQEAHDAGLVHRDVKPSNIFLVGSGADRFAKILDFGIAKRQADSPTTRRPDEFRTGTGVVLGTIHYMSPEQIRGRGLDGRADVWSLGMVAYRILTGRYPFHGESEASFLASVIADSPDPIDTFRPDIDPGLARTIMTALEREPSQRHASAAEFANALRPFGEQRGALRFSRGGSSPKGMPFDPTTPVGLAPNTEPLVPPSALAPTTPLARPAAQALTPVTRRSSDPELPNAPTLTPHPAPAHKARLPWVAPVALLVVAGLAAGAVGMAKLRPTQDPAGSASAVVASVPGNTSIDPRPSAMPSAGASITAPSASTSEARAPAPPITNVRAGAKPATPRPSAPAALSSEIPRLL